MKIDNINRLNAVNKYEQMKKPVTEQKPVSNNRDKLEISEDYAVYEKAVKALKETNDPKRLQKIEDLKDQVARGVYKVSSKELADIIINKVKNKDEF